MLFTCANVSNCQLWNVVFDIRFPLTLLYVSKVFPWITVVFLLSRSSTVQTKCVQFWFHVDNIFALNQAAALAGGYTFANLQKSNGILVYLSVTLKASTNMLLSLINTLIIPFSFGDTHVCRWRTHTCVKWIVRLQ